MIKFNLNDEKLIELSKNFRHVLTRTELIKFLNFLKEEKYVSNSLTLSKFENYLVKELKLFSEISIFKNGKKITRLINNKETVTPYQVALSLLSKSHLSHYSALFANQLTLNNPKQIFINKEQSIKKVDKKNAQLTQSKIDYAFSKPMRKTNNIAHFTMHDTYFEVHTLNSKNTNNTGVVIKKPFGFSEPIRVTNVERTLLDCTIRPNYSGGTSEILKAFKKAASEVSINKLNSYIKKFDYIYPYEQSILTYCLLADYPEEKTIFLKNTMEKRNLNLDFYLDYQKTQRSYNSISKTYYSNLLDI